MKMTRGIVAAVVVSLVSPSLALAGDSILSSATKIASSACCNKGPRKYGMTIASLSTLQTTCSNHLCTSMGSSVVNVIVTPSSAAPAALQPGYARQPLTYPTGAPDAAEAQCSASKSKSGAKRAQA